MHAANFLRVLRHRQLPLPLAHAKSAAALQGQCMRIILSTSPPYTCPHLLVLLGIGRGQPNQNPVLPPPSRGRILVQRTGRIIGFRQGRTVETTAIPTFIGSRSMFSRPPLPEGEVELQPDDNGEEKPQSRLSALASIAKSVLRIKR